MRLKKNLSKSQDGSTLVEFALLAPVFFLLITGMVEFVLYHYKLYALNHVVYEATRNLQTGEVQNWTDGDPATTNDMWVAFNNEVCAHAGAMLDCNNLTFDVRNFDTISAVTYPPATFDDLLASAHSEVERLFARLARHESPRSLRRRMRRQPRVLRPRRDAANYHRCPCDLWHDPA